MSYDIKFRVKVEGLEDTYISVGYCGANTTWNLREMIVKSTGLEWKNCENNGLCKDVIPKIAEGYMKLVAYPDKYKQYETENGRGTIEGCQRFFLDIINDWNNFCKDSSTKDLVDATYFWIV
jgi:hypothetical protein